MGKGVSRAKPRSNQCERWRRQEHDGDQSCRSLGRARSARAADLDADPSGNTTLGFFPREIPAVGLADALLDNSATGRSRVSHNLP